MVEAREQNMSVSVKSSAPPSAEPPGPEEQAVSEALEAAQLELSQPALLGRVLLPREAQQVWVRALRERASDAAC